MAAGTPIASQLPNTSKKSASQKGASSTPSDVSGGQYYPPQPKKSPFKTGATGALSKVTHEAGNVVNVRGLQMQLKRAGYDINVDGQLGPTTLSALRDYLKVGDGHTISPALAADLKGGPITGNRDPQKWNQQFGTSKTRSPIMRPNTGAGGSLNLDGTTKADTAQAMVNLSPQEQLATKLGKPIPEGLAKFGTLIDPSTADAIAGAQFDPQIREAQLALTKDPLQAATNAKDIGDWYGQALSSLKTAGARDNAAGTAGVNSIQDATSALVGSLGGSANSGAGTVASTGQNGADTLAAMNAAQDQYNNDMAPLMQNEKASQLTNQANKDSAQQVSDRVALENLQGQRGQALTTAQDQIAQENNSLAQARAAMLEGIKGDNNTLAQQGFNNSLALAQAQIAAMMSGLTVQTKRTALAKSANPNAFMYATPTTKNSAYQEALAALYDPSSHQKLNLTPQQAQARVASVLSGFGWTPAPGTPVGNFASGIVNTWQTAG